MGRTIFINCSPKRRLSVSGFLARCTGLMLKGEKVYMQLRTPADHEAILEQLKTADTVVFAIPLYIDSVPSHILPFMQKAETLCRQNELRFRVYVIANNGFIEGRQNEPLMRVMENFCVRSGLSWCGGVGIGGGVMLNVTRIMLTVVFGLTVINVILDGIQGQDMLKPLGSFGMTVLENTVLCCGIIAYLVRLAIHINKSTATGKRYTRVMLPSFVFIIFADIFFTIISILQGGIFRGWFKKHKQTAGCGIMVARDR